MKTCVTTNKIVVNDFIEFHCPMCNYRIVRSLEARAKSLAYKCPGCNFTGP